MSKVYCASLTGRRVYFEALSLDQAVIKIRNSQPKKNWRRLRNVSEAWWYSAELNGPLTDLGFRFQSEEPAKLRPLAGATFDAPMPILRKILQRRRKIRLDPTIQPLPLLISHAEKFPEFTHPRRYTWDLIKKIPITTLSPSSREAYETDFEIGEEEIEQNLRRYDAIEAKIMRDLTEIWPIAVDKHGLIIDGYHRLAVLADNGVKKIDVIWVRPTKGSKKNWRRLRNVSEAWWYSAELNGPLTDLETT